VETEFLAEQSSPEQDHYVFSYTITIENRSNIAIKLLRRHWIITDANNKIQEVEGEGVVGQQPHIKTGMKFRYSSGAILATPIGCMEGSYKMITDDGEDIIVPIPLFRLASNVTMH
ncbi:MAG: Co2+/Mg2+ efflux protein ApaG, partial [Gammaproteobacteria bacterium]|nr:Co2+/Mg2+ efflux protein ApaG [Gammaproteobacteria bacterium]